MQRLQLQSSSYLPSIIKSATTYLYHSSRCSLTYRADNNNKTILHANGMLSLDEAQPRDCHDGPHSENQDEGKQHKDDPASPSINESKMVPDVKIHLQTPQQAAHFLQSYLS